jgi:hypothetical protein
VKTDDPNDHLKIELLDKSQKSVPKLIQNHEESCNVGTARRPLGRRTEQAKRLPMSDSGEVVAPLSPVLHPNPRERKRSTRLVTCGHFSAPNRSGPNPRPSRAGQPAASTKTRSHGSEKCSAKAAKGEERLARQDRSPAVRAKDFSSSFTNNLAESDLRMVKLQQEISVLANRRRGHPLSRFVPMSRLLASRGSTYWAPNEISSRASPFFPASLRPE